MPTPNYRSYHLIKYADDTILLELKNNFVPSTLPSAAIELVDWFQCYELVLNIGETKQMISSNARDNPICDNLMINGTSVEQVELFTYLGTVVDSKLNFKSYTEAVVKKARKRLFIMKKLYSLRVARSIITRCYLTFIKSVFIYHICTLFGHSSKTCLSEFDHVIHITGSMAHCVFYISVYTNVVLNKGAFVCMHLSAHLCLS